MNPKLQEIVDEIQEKRKLLFQAVSELSPEDIKRRPGPDQWSIGELLHHLHLTESQITELLKLQLKRAEKRGLGPDTSGGSVINSLDQYSLEKVIQKVKAPPSAVPEEGLEKTDLLQALEDSRQGLLKEVERADSYDLSRLKFPHPFLGPLNMYQWILNIGKHEQRHTTQIVSIMETFT
jgi:uncharacterized damage-inducible protein DinB